MGEGRRRSPSSDATASTTIPLLFWSQLEDSRLVSDRIFSFVYSAFLRLPNGHCIMVAYKVPALELTASRRVMREARVLQALKGMPGVPRLYGVTTSSPKSALVMSFCPGVTLNNYQTVDAAKVYLSALLMTCRTLRQMHERGVTHGHVEPFNILVVANGKKEATYAFLLDFWLGTINGSEQDKKSDSEMLFSLILDIADMIEERNTELYERCRPLISLTDIRLYRIEAALKAALYGDLDTYGY